MDGRALREPVTDRRGPLADEPLWLEQARRGDRDAYGRIVEHYRERLYFAALGLVRNHDDARDISQEAFIRAWQALDRFQSGRPFYPWLYRIAHNLAIDHQRRHGGGRQLSLDALMEESHAQFADEEEPGRSAGDEAVERVQAEQMARHLRTAMEELKPEFREILLMKHYQDMAYREIAEALDIPIGTVMSRLFHARKALARLMERHRT